MFVGLRNLLLLFACLVIAAGQAWAVGLGKIEVTSHLGETFYAEAPIQLDTGEQIADVSVELASPSDYRILEVFRDPALNKLSVDVVNDQRGPRAVIKSTDAVDTPYFNLVLKLHYGHATNFKKYPVFLDLPEQVRPAATPAAPEATPAPAPTPATKAEPKPAPVVAAPAAAKPAAKATAAKPQAAASASASGFHPYQGWARTSRYGPMVRGDNITTVARRLAIDERYSLSQVMVALYDKNKSKFRAHNINMINAGTYLDVPTAKEVEAISDHQAMTFLAKQDAEWKQLQKQPVYAAEAAAQKNRYRTRVHMGESATGSAAAPLQAGQKQAAATSAQAEPKPSVSPVKGAQAAGAAAGEGMRQQFLALQQENQQLKQALQESQSKAAEAKPASAEAAASEAKVKKLELTVARLQRHLKLVNQQMQQVQAQKMDSVTYALGGIILLLIVVAGYLLYLLRRDRPHPPVVGMEQAVEEPAVAPAPEVAAPETVAAEETHETHDHEAAEKDMEEFAAALDNEVEEQIAHQHEDSLLFEEQAPKAQAGVDYLAEAEVYLRYGMDDEALQQMHLAIEQKPDHLQAHTKLVQFLKSRGDEAAVAAAIEAARSMLSGADLQAFEESLAEAPGGEAESAPIATVELTGMETEAAPAADAGDMNLMPELQATPEMDAALEEAMVAIQGEGEVEPEAEGAAAEDASDEPEAVLDLGDMQESQTTEQAGEADAEVAEAGDDEDQDFVSTIEISPLSEEEAEQGDEAQSGQAQAEEEGEGLDFSVPEDVPQVETAAGQPAEAGEEDDAGLAFEASSDEVEKDEEEVPETVIEASDDIDDLGLDDILGELDAQGDSGSDAVVDLAGDEVRPFDSGAADEGEVPETVIDSDSDVDDLGLDDILGEFGNDESTEKDAVPEDAGVPETIIDTGHEDDDDLGLDDILGEFEVSAEDEAAHSPADASASDLADMPEMDVSDELDGLLAEWGDEGKDAMVEAGPESLDVDRARSLLAEGQLDEAEQALQDVLSGERRGDALIGLAEVAARRGDQARKAELLAEAEPLVDDGNREWFETVSTLSV